MAHRVSRDEMLMDMAYAVARRGTCSRLRVGVVFSQDGRVISAGYNGAPAGMPHCDHYTYTEGDKAPDWVQEGFDKGFGPGRFQVLHELPPGAQFTREVGGELYTVVLPATGLSPSCPISEHAERNAIAFAARKGVALEGSTMHVTHMPCLDCARSIINAGVEEVVYHQPYRITSGVNLLERAGLTVVDYSLSMT